VLPPTCSRARLRRIVHRHSEGGGRSVYITPLITKGLPLQVFLSKNVHLERDKLTTRQREVLQLLARDA